MLRLTIDNGLNGFLDGAPLKSAQITNLAVGGNGYLIHRRIFREKSEWAWIEGVVEIVPLLLVRELNFMYGD